jgi:hypothetical protein
MNLKYLLSAVVAIAVVCALFAWYKKCPPPKKEEVVVVVEEEEKEEEEPELNETETRLYQYLETESKEKTIDMVDTVKDLFNINEVPLNDSSNDVVAFVRTVREWDHSIRKLEQKDAESMYNTINSLNIDSELFNVIINDHIKTCGNIKSTILFKRILKQLTDEAIKGQLFNVLFA